MNSFTTAQRINAREVPTDERVHVLPRHFGRSMMTVESAIYSFMRKLAHQYTGGYWQFFELSNGGFYMAPESETDLEIAVEGNGFEGTMTAQAAGITACLFALSHLSFRLEDEGIASHFHLLRHFALGSFLHRDRVPQRACPSPLTLSQSAVRTCQPIELLDVCRYDSRRVGLTHHLFGSSTSRPLAEAKVSTISSGP